MMKIAVVIVNYNTIDLTLLGIQSVLDRPLLKADVEIHVVDNASPNGDAKVLADAARTRNWGDAVTLYLEDTNHGFGRGNNVVLHRLAERAVAPDYVFLLNPDAYLKNDALRILLEFMQDHPKAALLGTRSFVPNDPKPMIAAFRFPGIGNTFSAAISFGPISNRLKKYHVALPANMPTQKVDWVSGAAVLARFDVLKSVNFFDPEYFLYYEEVDMMYAIAKAGWECWHVAEAEIIHVEGAATNVKGVALERPRRPAYWYHSWQYYFHKNHGRTYAIIICLAWIFGAAANHLLSCIRGKAPAAPAKFYGDFWTHAFKPVLSFGRGKP